jgi:thioesterase domain-containing protein|tara:strand:- start:156 stop:602 length:447 start_codon:yes stop_codon:yes gene_type:complete
VLGADAVQDYLLEKIPLARQMEARVITCDDTGVRLAAPLAPNINHRGTVFGGSASAVAMLCGWALVHARIADLPFDTGLVIRRQQMEFDHPIDGDFQAWCAMPEREVLQRFDTDLADQGKSRVELAVQLHVGERCAATFTGVYVALKS